MNGVIYARYSSDSQREESIEGQLRECREYAERRGITIFTTYIDRAMSARTADRPEFQRMAKNSADGLFDVVLVWKLDRFSRDRYDSSHYKRILRKNNVKVVSATENIFDGPEGIIMESVLEGYAEYYSVELSRKIHRGQKDNALKGKMNGGTIPLGYVLGNDKRLQIDPLTAPVVHEIFTRYASGETVRSIVESLNERHLYTRRGKPFSMNSFNALLKNRKYIGEYQYQDVTIPGGVPAILPEELFARVQARMEQNKRAPARTKAAEEYLLTTKLYCGNCQQFMVGESGTSHTGKIHYYYKCGNAKRGKGCKKKAVRKDWIEDLVITQIRSVLFDDTIMERIADKLVALQEQENTDMPLLQQQLQEVGKSIQNLLNAIEQGIFTPSTKQRLDELEQRKNDLEISLLQAEMERPRLSRDDILFWLHRFRKMDMTNTVSRQRLIDCFVNAIYLYDDKIIFTFNYKDGAKTVTLEDIDGSDLGGCTPPRNAVKSMISRHFSMF